MIDIREDRKTEKPEMVEAAEEVQVYGEAQTINENSGSSITDETGEEETLPESSSEPSAEEQTAEMKDRLLRALADLENTRRRSARDVEDARKYGSSGFARDLLNVSDNLRRGLEAVGDAVQESDETIKNLVQGIEMVERELLSAFERHGIKKVDPLGEPFDHNFHQAMYEKPDTEFANGTVAEVLQPGYVMHDRLLRPAMVAVAKGDSAAAPTDDLDSVDTTA
jgi:molecular chaperone GrpE